MKRETKVERLIFLVFAVWVMGCGARPAPGETQPPTTTAETPVPEQRNSKGVVGDFSLKDIDGKTYVLSDYLGKEVVVLSFFATWCEPCKYELTALRDYYRDHQNAGFVVFAVAMDEPETQGDVQPFAKQRRLNFPVLLDTELEAVSLFNPERQAPFVVVIDKAPSVYWSHYGYVPGDEKRLQSVVEAAVSERPAADDVK